MRQIYYSGDFIPDMLPCHYCKREYGYYEKSGGKDFVFKCIFCGMEVTAAGEKPAKAVLEIRHGDETVDIIVYRGEYDMGDMLEVIMANKITIISAKLRTIEPGRICEEQLLKNKGLRPKIAKLLCSYEWLVNFVGNYIQWRLNAQEKNKAARHKKDAPDKKGADNVSA